MTLNVTGYDPAEPADGVPVNTPADVNSTPAGNAPVRSHTYGARPPDATNVRAYAVPVTPSANEFVTNTSGANTSIERARVATRPSLSVARTVNENVFATVGVPDNTPDELNDTPAGNTPDATDHVTAPTPPTDATDPTYAVPVIPTGNDDVVTPRAVPATEIVNCFDPERPPASDAVTVKVNDPFTVCVGVPCNDDPTSDTPAGNAPSTDHVNDPFPPDALNACENATPDDANGIDAVVTVIGFTTNIDNTCDAVRPFASVAVTENENEFA